MLHAHYLSLLYLVSQIDQLSSEGPSEHSDALAAYIKVGEFPHPAWRPVTDTS